MNYLLCPKCGNPLSFEVEEVSTHNISEDGRFFVDDNFFTSSRRFNERLVCVNCDKVFTPEVEWWRDSEGKITLRDVRESDA